MSELVTITQENGFPGESAFRQREIPGDLKPPVSLQDSTEECQPSS